MKKIKIIKILLIISSVLSVLFLALFFILNSQAAACDPVWEINRHNALIDAANRFLYACFGMIAIAATAGTLLAWQIKNKK